MLKRVITLVISVLFLLGGIVVAIGGGFLMAVVGSDSSLRTGHERVSTPTSAVVAPVEVIEGTKDADSVLGQPRLRMSVTAAGQPVFVGVGPAAQVDEYLAGTSFDTVLDLELEPFSLRTQRHKGGVQSRAPGAESFWVAKSTGPNAAVDWTIRDGNYRLVIMNADARPAVSVDGQFALAVPELYRIAVGVLIVGIVGVLIGVTLLVIGLRIGRSAPVHLDG